MGDPRQKYTTPGAPTTAEKEAVPRRYFDQADRHEDAAVPTDHLLYLELTEVDEEAGVARFAYEVPQPDPDSELWAGTVEGWASRSDVLEAAQEAAFATLVTGGTLEIPLSRTPQVTQIEVRSADLEDVIVYRVETWGTTRRNFRYTTTADESFASSRGFLVEEDTEVYRLTADPLEATHVFGLTAPGGDEVDAVPIGSETNGLRMAVEGTRMKIYGG